MTLLTLVLLALAALAAVLVIASLRWTRRDSVDRRGTAGYGADLGPVAAVLTTGVAAPTSSQRSARSQGPVGPAARSSLDPLTVGVNRRRFLNRGILAVFVLGISSFGGAAVAFLWPSAGKGFGSKINVGPISDLKKAIVAGGGFYYVPEGRMWISEYPSASLEQARFSYSFFDQVEPGLSRGVTALYQVCPHLGCRVPECSSSQWFECPCHGSKYNRVGEKKAGPAPRGLDRFPMEVNAADELIVDTGTVILGPSIGVNTTGQEAEGPSCVGDNQPHV